MGEREQTEAYKSNAKLLKQTLTSRTGLALGNQGTGSEFSWMGNHRHRGSLQPKLESGGNGVERGDGKWYLRRARRVWYLVDISPRKWALPTNEGPGKKQ